MKSICLIILLIGFTSCITEHEENVCRKFTPFLKYEYMDEGGFQIINDALDSNDLEALKKDLLALHVNYCIDTLGNIWLPYDQFPDVSDVWDLGYRTGVSIPSK